MSAKILTIFKKNSFFLMGLGLTLLLSSFLFTNVYFASSEDSSLMKIFEMNRCFEDHQLPCRWVPDLGGSYGYPLFNYYAPLPYYYAEGFYHLTGNLIVAGKIMIATAFLGFFVFMYLFARAHLGAKAGGLFASVLSIGISSSILFYFKGGSDALWAATFFVGLLWAINKLYQDIKLFNFLTVGVFSSLLVLSHNFSLIIFLPLSLAYSFVLTRKVEATASVLKNKFVLYVFISLIVGLFLSAFYWIPAFFERNLVHNEKGLEFLPINAVDAPTKVANSKYEILTGDVSISNFEQGSHWFKFNTDVKTHSIVRISQYYFPNWIIKIDGAEAHFEYRNNDLGLMTLILGKGIHHVEARLENTIIRSLSNAFSAGTFFIVVVLYLSSIKRMRKWFNYYVGKLN